MLSSLITIPSWIVLLRMVYAFNNTCLFAFTLMTLMPLSRTSGWTHFTITWLLWKNSSQSVRPVNPSGSPGTPAGTGFTSAGQRCDRPCLDNRRRSYGLRHTYMKSTLRWHPHTERLDQTWRRHLRSPMIECRKCLSVVGW